MRFFCLAYSSQYVRGWIIFVLSTIGSYSHQFCNQTFFIPSHFIMGPLPITSFICQTCLDKVVRLKYLLLKRRMQLNHCYSNSVLWHRNIFCSLGPLWIVNQMINNQGAHLSQQLYQSFRLASFSLKILKLCLLIYFWCYSV